MELHLKIIGFCLIALGLVHAIFPRQFNWKQELSSLSIVNREMMYVHTFFIAFTLFLVGLLCWTSATDLVGTTFGKRVSLGLGIFFFKTYRPVFWLLIKDLEGKALETTVHVLFSIFWTYVTVIFISAYLS